MINENYFTAKCKNCARIYHGERGDKNPFNGYISNDHYCHQRCETADIEYLNGKTTKDWGC